MSAQIEGGVQLVDSGGRVILELDAGKPPYVRKQDHERMDGKGGAIKLTHTDGDSAFRVWTQWDGGQVKRESCLELGGGDHSSRVTVLDGNQNAVLEFNSREAQLRLGCRQNTGSLVFPAEDGGNNVQVFGSGVILLGCGTKAGSLRVHNPQEHQDVIVLDGETSSVQLQGSAFFKDSAGRPVVHISGGKATVHVGMEGEGSDDSPGDRIGEGQPGGIVVHGWGGRSVFRVEGSGTALSHTDVHVGAKYVDGNIWIYDKSGKATIFLDGGSGDIQLLGADVAEQFRIDEGSQTTPGTVMIMGNDGNLHPCDVPYDKRVVGVVSGAGGVHPGLVLGEDLNKAETVPVAIAGKVYCNVDADYGPIEIGDLLTTSSTLGHAMRRDPASQRAGTIVGKALQSLQSGRDVIQMLVCLL